MSTLLIDLAGTELSQEEVEILHHPLVAGVILFSRNFYDLAQIQALVKSLRQRVNKRLLITVDQEGGRVQRFRQGFTQLPAMQAFAQQLEDPQVQQAMALEAGWTMASEMRALDIDLSFAPVLDLGHQCQAIGDRSFGEDWQQVVNLARAFILGMQQAKMSATGKHFPGHGQVIADSHLETPIDDRSPQAIWQQDIKPFQTLIEQNLLAAIMPAHVVYSQCDSQPASGSSYWLQQVLRQQLGFKGVIFSDDLGMEGASFMGDFVQRSHCALKAGCDLLLLCNNPQAVIQLLDHFKYQETTEQASLRQQRIQTLFRPQPFNWRELTCSPRWIANHNALYQLQQNWLASKQG
ncbi:beta-N-acetylhexosaminidase [Volucribacter amazonae]|uniref:Beta-hexosaminidase n=1 Tax=Volucribacter amazonae TaxID=256731 RepID=A0A9X4PDE7_9PAST|nr:beta-N-acetylhexosaminidase [Volucribacter amazonae]MDG6896117.1 beta-N-acetylhexosaminidase [Volucribacter amazonae]